MTDTADRQVSLEGFNPFDADTLQCPWPFYEKMRDDEPVMQVPGLGFYLVTRHDLVLDVLRDTETFSSKFTNAGMPVSRELAEKLLEYRRTEGWEAVPTMLTADPPEHTRYRKLVSKAFTPRVIKSLEPTIREITTRLIDSWIDDGDVEFVERFAVPLPVEVIARALNVPDDRLADFKRWSDDSIAAIGTDISEDERWAAERGITEFQHYFAEQFERRRSEPQDDILTSLLNARIDDDDDPELDKRPLEMGELLSIVAQLLVAGNETTTKMLTEMMRLLGESPDQWAAVRADPARVSPIVEETLRLSTPTQGMWRIATKDTEIAGVPIPAKSRVIIVFCSANRDEALFNSPDSFDPDRANLRDHLAFGKGTHYCLGAALSRLEGNVALQELSRRVESFTLADTNDYAYFPSFLLRGLTRLDLEIVPARDPGIG